MSRPIGPGLYHTIFLPLATRRDDFAEASKCARHGCPRTRLLGGQLCRAHAHDMHGSCDNLRAMPEPRDLRAIALDYLELTITGVRA